MYSELFATLGARDVGVQDTNGRLVQAADGNFYGTTYDQGAQLGGTIFRLTPSGTLSAIFAFGEQPSDLGIAPRTGLTVGADGNLYGTTSQGSGNSVGAWFKMAPGGSPSVLRYNNPYGAPAAFTPLSQAKDGSLYAAIHSIPHNQQQLTNSWVSRVKLDGSTVFEAPMDRTAQGAEPLAGLVEGFRREFLRHSFPRRNERSRHDLPRDSKRYDHPRPFVRRP